jgi:glycosyltransferase involved in cell wall biosynthesis
MSRIFVVGAGPLMDGGARRVTAHAMRTWHFVTALRRAGHEIALCTVSQNISPTDPIGALSEPREKEGFAYENLDMRAGNMLEGLRERCAAFRPDAVVGVATEPASWACRMRATAPVWADLHGWVMAEAQLKAARDGDDEIIGYFWGFERPVLRRADKISAVSDAQKMALYGELATVGRLNRYNADFELVATIPSSVLPEKNHRLPTCTTSNPVAKLIDDPNAFVVLWSGAFNLWTDPATLYDALEYAMARDGSIHFIATAGKIPGHADAVFDAFESRVAASPNRARYHLLGWVPSEDFPGFLAHSHLAICADFPCVETLIGTRTRLLEAMAHGLPVLTTRGTEVSGEFERHGAAHVVPPHRPELLGQALLERAADREVTAALGRKGRAFALEHYSIARTMAPLIEWAEHPRHAPDNDVKRRQSPTIFEAAVNRLEEDARALDSASATELAAARRDLDRLRSKWPFRLWRLLRKFLKAW